MKKYLKLRKHTFKNIYKFLQSLTDKQLFNKRLVFPNEFIPGTFENMCVKCRGRPMVRKCPAPGLR